MDKARIARLLAVALVVGLVVALAPAANADTYKATGWPSWAGGGYSFGSGIGGIFDCQLLDASNNLFADRSLCASTGIQFNLNTTYNATKSLLTGTWQEREVAWLVDNYLPAASNADQNDALQSAVWRIYLGGDPGYPTMLTTTAKALSDSNVLAANGQGSYVTTTAYLVNLYDSTGVLHQPQFVKVIPEPMFFQMGALLGLGGLGLFRSRRKGA